MLLDIISNLEFKSEAEEIFSVDVQYCSLSLSLMLLFWQASGIILWTKFILSTQLETVLELCFSRLAMINAGRMAGLAKMQSWQILVAVLHPH